MSTARIAPRALRALTKPQSRSLSMTGPATFSSLLTSDKPARGSNAPRLPASAKLPIPDAGDAAGKPARHFNTSRSLKAVGDTSTIDFMFIPDFDPDLKAAPVEVRVPILPWTEASAKVKAEATEAETPVMIPTIHTVAADGTHIHAPSAMSDMTDSDHIDFQGMATSVASKLASRPRADGEGMTRQILSGLWEDIVGPKQGHART
ncbi:hypothetical protein FB567DRAFT_7152 [Paraphoma chrysanthemicola]|uniref:Uncharacterized protein n=1 Tax=Paraphoma chrysanthemicola TaxID=798071 RepID=A0A8K0RGV2_9PLEO|nr:hypothetical protein FB567DRAFT_7152 [Paraphoma chrysanthemicola]